MTSLRAVAYRLLPLLALATMACTDTIRDQVVAISGPLCTASLAAGETNHCYPAPSCNVIDDPSRCVEMVSPYNQTDTSGTLGTVYWKSWWLRPKGRTQADMAGRVPLLWAHGMTMNEGWTRPLIAAAKLADVTGRPVLITAEIVAAPNASGYGAGITSNSITFVGKGNASGARWLLDLGVTGSGANSWSWEGAYSTVSQWSYGCPNYKTGYRPDGKKMVDACANYKVIRSGPTYVGTEPWALAEARRMAIANGLVGSTTKFDAVGQSQGPLAIAVALANHNGVTAGPTDQYFSNSSTTGFAANIRNVISINGANLGAIDTALGDLAAQASSNNGPASRPAFVSAWNYTGSPVNKPKWYALATASCARPQPSKPGVCNDDAAGNYMFGMVCGNDLGTIPFFNSANNWKGDGVVPLEGQYSPWSNSAGVTGPTVGGKATKFFRRWVFDCFQSKTVTDTSGTVTSNSGLTYLGQPGVFGWKGSHKWLITDADGWAAWLPVLEEVCLASGASCATEISCYTGPAGTGNVGECRTGHRMYYEPTTTCNGQVLPSSEICDGKDNDCDGVADDGWTTSQYVDSDGDGYGSGSLVSITGCSGYDYPGYSTNNTDCLPNVSTVNPNYVPGAYAFHGGENGGAVSWDRNCDGATEPHCGDNMCNGTETIASCSADCRASYFSTTNTNYAAQNTNNISWSLAQGQVLKVTNCGPGGSYSGNPSYRLYYQSGTQVATASYGCTAITYTAANSGIYTLKRGCIAAESCSAYMSWSVNDGPSGLYSDQGTTPPAGSGGTGGGGGY